VARPVYATYPQAVSSLRDAPPGIRLKWVGPGEAADLRLAVDPDQLWLLPADGRIVREGPGRSVSVGLDETAAALRSTLEENLRRAAKALNLKRIASQPSNGVLMDSVIAKLYIRLKAGGAAKPFLPTSPCQPSMPARNSYSNWTTATTARWMSRCCSSTADTASMALSRAGRNQSGRGGGPHPTP
jgi:hypothetical protein